MALKYIILGLIRNRPLYGYEIKQMLSQSYGDVINVSYGQLYPTLKNLSRDGLLKRNVKKGQKSHERNVYSITDQGIQVFERWIINIPKEIKYSGKDEFSMLITFFYTYFSKEKIRNIILNQIIYTQRRKKEIQDKINEDHAREIYLLHRKMFLHMEADEKWYREILSGIIDTDEADPSLQ